MVLDFYGKNVAYTSVLQINDVEDVCRELTIMWKFNCKPDSVKTSSIDNLCFFRLKMRPNHFVVYTISTLK